MKTLLTLILFSVLGNTLFAQRTTSNIVISNSEAKAVLFQNPGYQTFSMMDIGKTETGTFRTYVAFDISQVTNALNFEINEVKIRYSTVNTGNYEFSTINIVSPQLNPNGTINLPGAYDYMGQADAFESNIDYEAHTSQTTPEIVTSSLKAYINNNPSVSKLHIGIKANNESSTAANTVLNIFEIAINYSYDTNYSMTVRNDFMGQYGGLVGVGVNSSVVQRNSPYTFNAQNGTQLNLQAYDNQVNGLYTWVFNDSEATESKSLWQKTFVDRPSVDIGYSQSIQIYANNDSDAKVSNLQRRLHNVSRIDQTEMGNTSAGVVATAVQGNDTTITAPATKTVSGKTLYFTSWSDGVGSNPRTVEQRPPIHGAT